MEERKIITPTEFFEDLKHRVGQTEEADLKRYYATAVKLLDKALRTGQSRQVSKLMYQISTIERETEIRELGIDRFVYTADVKRYIQEVEHRVVKLVELAEYPREIPDTIVKTIEQVKDKFDKLVIVFTDYSDEVGQAIAQDARDKDPILFGVFYDENSNELLERMYFLGDWEDEYCDLTLTKLIEEYKDISEDEVVFYMESANAEEIVANAKNYNDELKRIHATMEPVKKKPLFTRISSFLGIGSSNE